MKIVRASLVIALLIVGLVSLAPAHGQQAGPFRVYLTFEDGPTESYTPTILDILAQYNAKATFFVNGYQIAGREWILQRVLYEGHALGNHLWVEQGHYTGAADDAVRESYWRTEEAIQAALGDALPIYQTQTKLYRTPGGGSEPFPPTEGVAVISYNWHVSGNDCGAGLVFDGDLSVDDQILRNIFDNPPYFNVWDYGDGVVIVLHDINGITERILPTVLSRLQAAGATFHALPRPEDQVNTMPVVLGAAPVVGAGVPGTRLPGRTLDNVHFRAAPDLNAALVTADSLPMDADVIVTGRADGWYQVEYAGQVGWVAADYMYVEGPVPNLPLTN
jgi:peptidoglycan/xylan/chitin deacetylase (PgdA/CDA1 family)